MKSFNGKVLFLDRADINTDEIIPAKYLTEITKEALKPHLLEDLSLEEFDPQTEMANKKHHCLPVQFWLWFLQRACALGTGS